MEADNSRSPAHSIAERWNPFLLALGGVVLLALATPPFAIGWLAWIAPLPWLRLIVQRELSGRRPYLQIYAAGALLWLWQLEGIRLAHPALVAGWIALALYLAVYLPLFIALSRVAVQRIGVPLVIAAPIIWTGLEVIRAYFLTGFALLMLGHTQAEYPVVIQIASLAGGYAVGFVMVTAAAGVFDAIRAWRSDSRALFSAGWRLGYAVVLVAATFVYGLQALREPSTTTRQARVALIQGSLDTVFELNPQRIRETFDQYHELTAAARDKLRELDLVVWPESSCPMPYTLATEKVTSPVPNMSDAEFRARLLESNGRFEQHAADVVAALNAPDRGPPRTQLVFGTTTLEYAAGPPQVFNSAIFVDANGKVAGRYDKMHAVMFGEYIPLARWFPILYRITPMSEGMSEGTAPKSFVAGGVRFSPSICFESTVPHLLRRQVARLTAAGEEPDALLNITNDGWFWGSAILDHHLRCAIFRAVEVRKPLVVAANTGISAHIDGSGRVLERGPKRQTAELLAIVQPDGRRAPYLIWGDTPAALCGAFAVLCGALPLLRRKPKS